MRDPWNEAMDLVEKLREVIDRVPCDDDEADGYRITAPTAADLRSAAKLIAQAVSILERAERREGPIFDDWLSRQPDGGDNAQGSVIELSDHRPPH